MIIAMEYKYEQTKKFEIQNGKSLTFRQQGLLLMAIEENLHYIKICKRTTMG